MQLSTQVKQLLVLAHLLLVVLAIDVPLFLRQNIQSSVTTHNQLIIKMTIELVCYASLATLTLVNYFHALPIWLNTSSFSILIIVAGSHRSLNEMISQFKSVHVYKKKSSSEIETISKEDAM